MHLTHLLLILGLTPIITQEQLSANQQNIAQLLAEKGLSKIISPDVRKRTRADSESITEEYSADGRLKSRETEHSPINGKLELRGINIDDLYKALGTRYDFYIDDSESTAVIDNQSCAVIKFKPKPNLPISKVADQFINRAQGSIYINLDGLRLIKLVGSIKEPFHFTFWALFIPIGIDIYQFRFSINYTVFNNATVEQNLDGLADYEIRNRGMEKFTSKISNYRTK